MDKVKCEICGGEFDRCDVRMGTVVPAWFDEGVGGAKTEPYARGIVVDACEACYRKTVAVYARPRVGDVEFRPFPAKRRRGMAMGLYTQGGDDGFDPNWWMEIVCDDDGVPDMEKVMAEFRDFQMLIRNICRVYDEITDGAISEPNADPSEVITAVYERIKSAYDEGYLASH